MFKICSCQMRQHFNRKQFANFSNLMRKIYPPFVRPSHISSLLLEVDRCNSTSKCPKVWKISKYIKLQKSMIYQTYNNDPIPRLIRKTSIEIGIICANCNKFKPLLENNFYIIKCLNFTDHRTNWSQQEQLISYIVVGTS